MDEATTDGRTLSDEDILTVSPAASAAETEQPKKDDTDSQDSDGTRRRREGQQDGDAKDSRRGRHGQARSDTGLQGHRRDRQPFVTSVAERGGRASGSRDRSSAARAIRRHSSRDVGPARVASVQDTRGFADLLSLDDVDRFLTTTAIRIPFFRLVKAGEQIPESSYTRSGRTGSRDVQGMADPARVTALFEDGATLVLQGVHRWHEPVTRFCRELELELGHPCQANAYITPAGAQGLALHEDAHDVFVLQAFGHKRWELHGAPAEDARAPIQAEVTPGDYDLHAERTPHAASTQDALSGHLTIGVHVTRGAKCWPTCGPIWRRNRRRPAGAGGMAERPRGVRARAGPADRPAGRGDA